MSELDYLDVLNQKLINEILLIVCTISLTVFYRRKDIATWNVAYLVSLLYIVDALMLPILYLYSGYTWSYLAWSCSATLMAIRLTFRIKNEHIEVSNIEISILICECFIVLCLLCRFVDKFMLSKVVFSGIYSNIVNTASLLVVAVLFVPLASIIINKIKSSMLLQPGLYRKFDKILFSDINFSSNKRR